jgi:hypothetical protein
MMERRRFSASIWIWRTRSRVTPICSPTSSRVARSKPCRTEAPLHYGALLVGEPLEPVLEHLVDVVCLALGDGLASSLSGIMSSTLRSPSRPMMLPLVTTRSLSPSIRLTSSGEQSSTLAISSGVGSRSSCWSAGARRAGRR